MKKRILFAIFCVVFGLLLVLNVSFISNGDTSGQILQNYILTASADGEGSGNYAQRNTQSGTVTEEVTINEILYTRTCKYHQITCIGSGDISCTSGLTTYGCTSWVVSE